MAGLYIRELIMRADSRRILVVAPGSLVEQWRDELFEKFGLQFNVFSSALEAATPTGNPFEDLDHLIRKADRMGTTGSQMDIVTSRVNLNVAVTVASLDAPAPSQGPAAPRMGYVVVIEDITDLLRAQKQTAWSEVARRVAHEIKNPLTPIALSAERIRRHLERGTPPDAASLKIIRNCVVGADGSHAGG